MSSLSFLVTELQSLASETRRKYPEVREAAEKSLAILRASPEQATSLATDGPQSDDLLRPVFMGCATKNAKVVAISLGSLQRLISLRAVPQSAVPHIVTTMSDAMSQGVDIQLRILQTLVSLIPNFPHIHGELLGQALLLCFKLQESRIAVVSSTAAATLRQLVMFVMDKMVSEDRIEDMDTKDFIQVQLPDGSTKSLGPSAHDAYSVFEDLCLLANGEKPHFLRLEFLHKTFALELVESVLANYHVLFRKRHELVLLLQHHLCPLLLKSLSDRPLFPLMLRCTRVIFLLLKQFSSELITEAEVFLMLLIRIISEEDPESSHSSPRPSWMRVIAMEIMRGLCSDAELMRNLWSRYDAQESGSKVFFSLIAALKRLITEKPALLGVNQQIYGVGVHNDSSASLSTLDGMAGRVATAASATVSGVVGMMSHNTGLSLQGSSMKLQCIDQLDKADAPPIPETYIFLLALQCIVSLCEGFAAFTGPLYTQIVIQKPRSTGDGNTTIRTKAPPSLDLTTLPPNDYSTHHLKIVKDIIENGWPALLAALSFIIATNIEDELFTEVLMSYQALINVSGMLDLSTPRDAFFTSLAKFAVPTRVVSSLDTYSYGYSDGSGQVYSHTPRSATMQITDGIGLTHSGSHSSGGSGSGVGGGGGGAGGYPPGLSERNLACLKVYVGCALFLMGSLGKCWFGVLEVLQNAEYVLLHKGTLNGSVVGSGKRGILSPGNQSQQQQQQQQQQQSGFGVGSSGGQGQGQGNRHPLLMDLESESLQASIQRLFDASKNMEDDAFREFVGALCRLSGEMIGMQSVSVGLVEDEEGHVSGHGEDGLKSDVGGVNRRRVSGIHIPKTLRSGDFGIARLGNVAMLNIHRLIYHSPDVAWDTTTTHLLSVIRLPIAPQPIRIQAARVLDEILLVVPRNLSSTGGGDLQAQVQNRVLSVLAQQVVPDGSSGSGSGSGYNVNTSSTNTGVELRKMGLETLFQILQGSVYSLVTGWETIFYMLESVCRPLPPARTGSLDSVSALASASASASVLGSGAVGHGSSVPASPTMTRSRPTPIGLGLGLGLGIASERSYALLVKIAFQSLTLVCDSISTLSPNHLRLCISTLGQFGRQADTNIALTAATSLLWSVSDSIQMKRKEGDEETKRVYSELWMDLLGELKDLCEDGRKEVRDGAIQSVVRAVGMYGDGLGKEVWERCLWSVVFPLLESLTLEIRKFGGGNVDENEDEDGFGHAHDGSRREIDWEALKDWDESKILALTSIGSIFHDFLASALIKLDSFVKAWEVFVGSVKDAVLVDNRSVTAPALRSLEKAIKAAAVVVGTHEEEDEKEKDKDKEKVGECLEMVWEAIDVIGDVILNRGTSVSVSDSVPSTPTTGLSTVQPFTQESLVAFVDMVQSTRITSRALTNTEWSFERLTRLMAILKGVLTYSDSPDYRPDIDVLPPVQSVVMSTVTNIYLSVPGSPSLIMRDISEFVTLPFLAAFDVKPDPRSHSPKKRVTYIAIAKKAMPMLVDLFLQFKNSSEVYVDGTLEAILGAYSIPMKLKYDCPAPSKSGKDLPLWKTAIKSFLTIVDAVTTNSKELDQDIPDERLEGIWRQLLDGFKGAILADCSVALGFPLDIQAQEEDFDMALLKELEEKVVPHLGNPRIPDILVSELSRILHRGGEIYPLEGVLTHAHAKSSEAANVSELGSTEFGNVVPRERFSYWCLDLLFSICSSIPENQESSRKRLAALSIPSLLNRCRSTLIGYVADESLRGNLPFPRAREDELLHVLQKLLHTRVWPGSVWAALSDDPTRYVIEQPAIDVSNLSISELMADAVKRSPAALLFQFYPTLLEIASKPRRTPSAWTFANGVSHDSNSKHRKDSKGKLVGQINNGGNRDDHHGVVELDARVLARDCLKVIGQEIGVSSR